MAYPPMALNEFFLNIKPPFHRRKLHKYVMSDCKSLQTLQHIHKILYCSSHSCGMYIVRCLINNSVHLTVNYAQLYSLYIRTMCNSVNCITLSNTQLCACFNLFLDCFSMCLPSHWYAIWPGFNKKSMLFLLQLFILSQ